MLRKAVLAFGLLLPVAALAEESATDFENYRSWTLAEEYLLPPMELSEDTDLKLYVAGAVVRKIYVENIEDRYSRFVAEFELLGKAVVRVFKDGSPGPEVFQMLVKNEWRRGKVGAQPKIYLVWKQSFPLFGKRRVVGLRLTLEAADGKKPLETVVMVEK
jgi:hypothetical protein